MITESSEDRSRIMRAVKSKNTTPEKIIRKLVYSSGFRYRLYRADLPGKPDLVFPKLKKVIFIHGCFWHGHHCKRGNRVPKNNRPYWQEKIQRNKNRDKKNRRLLTKLGWRTLTIWECEIHSKKTESKIKNFLRS